MGSGRAVPVAGTGRGVVRGRGMVRGRRAASVPASVPAAWLASVPASVPAASGVAAAGIAPAVVAGTGCGVKSIHAHETISAMRNPSRSRTRG